MSMKYTHRVQVLFTEKQYRSLEKIAVKSRKKLGALVRETVEETYLKQEKLDRIQDAVAALLKIGEETPAPPPDDWDAWEKTYGRSKSGRRK